MIVHFLRISVSPTNLRIHKIYHFWQKLFGEVKQLWFLSNLRQIQQFLVFSTNFLFCTCFLYLYLFLVFALVSCSCTCFLFCTCFRKWAWNCRFELENTCLEKQNLGFQKYFNFQFSQHILRYLEISQISRKSEKESENVAPKTLFPEAIICSNICQIEMKSGRLGRQKPVFS